MIVEVYQRVVDLAKTGTSGMETEEEINGIINSAQKSLQQMLLDVAEINQKASDALSWLKTGFTATSAVGGIVTLPEDYLHLDTLELVQGGSNYPMFKIATNQRGMTRTSAIRKANLTKNRALYYFTGTKTLTVQPEQSGVVVNGLYYKVVPDATITLTPTSSDDSDMVEPAVGVDFGWPQSMFNILVYLILEGLGIEIKETLLLEYSAFGITREMIKTSPQ